MSAKEIMYVVWVVLTFGSILGIAACALMLIRSYQQNRFLKRQGRMLFSIAFEISCTEIATLSVDWSSLSYKYIILRLVGRAVECAFVWWTYNCMLKLNGS